MDYYFCPTARAGGEEREERRGADDDGDDDLCEKKSCKGFYLTDPGKAGREATADATGREADWQREPEGRADRRS